MIWRPVLRLLLKDSQPSQETNPHYRALTKPGGRKINGIGLGHHGGLELPPASSRIPPPLGS